MLNTTSAILVVTTIMAASGGSPTNRDRLFPSPNWLVFRSRSKLKAWRVQKRGTRHQARKELSEQDPDRVLAELESWVASLDTNSADYEHHLVEAMWACQNVERVSEDILKRVLASRDGQARSAGARMIRYWHEQLSDPIAMIAKASADSFPRTRMEAVPFCRIHPERRSIRRGSAFVGPARRPRACPGFAANDESPGEILASGDACRKVGIREADTS